MRRDARRRIVKAGADTTGGSKPSNRCPPIGSSPEMIGCSSSPSVGIEHNLDDCRVVECDAELVAERVLEFADETGMGTELGHAALLKGPAPSRSMIER